jgi:hypothetical protein
VSPSHIHGSDITLSDCHYDAPFKYIYQEGNIFLRLILSVNENKTVYTQIEDATSLLSTGDYNIIDYNQDYHCVHGKIPKNKDRVLLKLHYIAKPKYSTDISTEFCKYINDSWTHLSRELMRDSINPITLTQHVKKNIVLFSRFIWNYATYLLIFFVLIFFTILILRCYT